MNGKKCLLISPVAENNFGGGIGLNKSRILLTELFRDNLYCVDFRMGVLSNVQKLRWTLQGYTVGLTRSVKTEALAVMAREAPDYVFINSSNYGLLAKAIKKRYPGCKIVTFFHNVEIKYSYDVVRRLKKIGNVLSFFAFAYNEWMAIRYSDTIIALSERDSALLHKIYKRSADFLVPVTFDDKLDYNKLTERRDQKPRGIFAGSLFFPNEYGVRWFVQHVAPHVNA